MKTSLLKRGKGQWCLLFSLLFKTILEDLPSPVMQEKNVIKIGKEEMELSLFADHMSVHGENSKEFRNEV